MALPSRACAAPADAAVAAGATIAVVAGRAVVEARAFIGAALVAIAEFVGAACSAAAAATVIAALLAVAVGHAAMAARRACIGTAIAEFDTDRIAVALPAIGRAAAIAGAEAIHGVDSERKRRALVLAVDRDDDAFTLCEVQLEYTFLRAPELVTSASA